MARFYSDQYAPRGGTAADPGVVTTGILPRRRFKSPSGLSRVPVHTTRAYIDFRNSANPVLTTGDQFRIMKIKSSDRIFELNLWVSDAGRGSWAGSLVIDVGIEVLGQNHDGIDLGSGFDKFFASAIDIVGGGPFQGFNLMTEAINVDENFRGWQLWEMLTTSTGVFSDVNDPVTEFDIVCTVASGTPTGTQGALTFEMLFAPAGT